MTAFKHPFNDERCARRLLWEYQNYEHLIVGVDFDNTIRPVKPDSSCEEVIELLRRCSKDPKITLCLWSICSSQEEEQEKLDYCESLGITIDHINYSPFQISSYEGRKQYFNVLLDDRAGLESAYNNLKYVLDNADTQSYQTRAE